MQFSRSGDQCAVIQLYYQSFSIPDLSIDGQSPLKDNQINDLAFIIDNWPSFVPHILLKSHQNRHFLPKFIHVISIVVC